jgi:digeranylgeranylglycerophospholipid reductase
MIESRINAAQKVQSRWLALNNEQWDKEIQTLKNISEDEFVDFIRADFTASKMLKLSLHHPQLIARKLFEMVLGK